MLTLSITRFLSSPFIIRVPFFILFCVNKETPKYKGQKGTTLRNLGALIRGHNLLFCRVGGHRFAPEKATRPSLPRPLGRPRTRANLPAAKTQSLAETEEN